MAKQTVYFITGGNRGIGFELVKRLSENENNIIITSARNIEQSADLSQVNKKRTNVHVVKLDVASKTSVFEAAGEVSKIADKVDVLISNAGVSEAFGTVLDTDEDDWSTHWKTNVLGPVLLYQAFYPLLAKGDAKKIIFMSSMLGSIGGFLGLSVSAYGQSKAAMNYTTKEISTEVAEKGFTVVAVHPGLVSTDTGSRGFSTILAANPHLKDMMDNSTITPETCATTLVDTFAKLTPESNGKFINNDGTELPW